MLLIVAQITYDGRKCNDKVNGYSPKSGGFQKFVPEKPGGYSPKSDAAAACSGEPGSIRNRNVDFAAFRRRAGIVRNLLPTPRFRADGIIRFRNDVSALLSQPCGYSPKYTEFQRFTYPKSGGYSPKSTAEASAFSTPGGYSPKSAAAAAENRLKSSFFPNLRSFIGQNVTFF
jgi:hypothetical protein